MAGRFDIDDLLASQTARDENAPTGVRVEEWPDF